MKIYIDHPTVDEKKRAFHFNVGHSVSDFIFKKSGRWMNATRFTVIQGHSSLF